MCRQIVKRCTPLIGTAKMGDVAATFKTVGEMLILGGQFKESVTVLELALSIFPKVTQVDCSVRGLRLAWRGVARRGVAWRGVAWRGRAWRACVACVRGVRAWLACVVCMRAWHGGARVNARADSLGPLRLRL